MPMLAPASRSSRLMRSFRVSAPSLLGSAPLQRLPTLRSNTQAVSMPAIIGANVSQLARSHCMMCAPCGTPGKPHASRKWYWAKRGGIVANLSSAAHAGLSLIVM